MTNTTNRNNIKTILFCVTIVMMIMLGLSIAITAFASFNARQFFTSDGVLDRIYSITFGSYVGRLNIFFVVFYSFITLAVFTRMSSLAIAAFFCASIVKCVFNTMLLILFTPLLTRQIMTQFTQCLMSIFRIRLSVVFRKWFNLFAFVASFCYNRLRHFRSFQRTWSEPVMGYYTPVSGLFYITRENFSCQDNFIGR